MRKTDSKTRDETLSLGGVYERRTSGGTVQHIFYVQGSDGHLAQITYDETTKAESRAYVHPDALGSASAVTDDNKVVTRFDNEPFGKRVQPSGDAFSGAFPSVQVGFTGHSMDDDLGLVNMKGRIYDPSQRRFLSPDPLVARPLNAQGYNRYSYVYNNPLSFTDPSGFEGEGSDGNYCTTHPNDPPCAPAPPGGAGPGSVGNWVENPSAGGCGPGTNHPCPTSAPAGPSQLIASKYHVVFVPVVTGTGDKWNPHSFEGQIQKGLFGSAPEIDYLAATQPPPEVVSAMMGFVPGLNSALVFANAKSTTFDKALAVGTDVLSVVGVGTVLKLGAKGVGLAKGVVVAEELGVAAAHGAPQAYSVAFEVTLANRAAGAPLLSRAELYAAHFAQGNEQILRSMADPELATALRGTLGANFEGNRPVSAIVTVLSPPAIPP